MEKIRVFTAFSGYDSQCLALERLKRDFPGIDYELVGWSEIDRHAIEAHDALFPQWAERNYGDISKIDWAQVPDFDLFTYSFPCTDISQSGRREGLAEGSGTRSSLLWECCKAIEVKKPRWLLMENVDALVSKKFIGYFQKWVDFLTGQGYASFSAVLNAKDYGVPQSRKRVFCVSIRDFDGEFHFPKPIGCERRLRDVLESDVDERFYLRDEVVENFLRNNARKKSEGNGFQFKPSTRGGYSKTVPTQAFRETATWIDDNEQQGILQIGNIFNNGEQKAKESHPYIAAVRGREPNVLTPRRTEYGKAVRREYERGELREPRRNMQRFEPRTDGVSNTLTSVSKDNYLVEPGVKKHPKYRIRKLTPRECFRLMDVDDADIDKIQRTGICNSQQYKLAGNSIVVNVLYHIFRKMFVEQGNEEQQLTLF